MSKAIDLSGLATQINSMHEAVGKACQSSLGHARECGQLLLEAKTQVRHGQWLKWLRENVRCTPRTTQYYVKIAQRWELLSSKSETVSLLTLRAVIKQLQRIENCAPAPPPGDPEPENQLLAFAKMLFRTEPRWRSRLEKVLKYEEKSDAIRAKADRLKSRAGRLKDRAGALRERLERAIRNEFERRSTPEDPVAIPARA